MARWFAELQDYNLQIKHIAGKIHAAADMLSRPPGVDQGKEDNTDLVSLPTGMFIRTIHDGLQQRVIDSQVEHGRTMEEWEDQYSIQKSREWYKDTRLVVPVDVPLR